MCQNNLFENWYFRDFWPAATTAHFIYWCIYFFWGGGEGTSIKHRNNKACYVSSLEMRRHVVYTDNQILRWGRKMENGKQRHPLVAFKAKASLKKKNESLGFVDRFSAVCWYIDKWPIWGSNSNRHRKDKECFFLSVDMCRLVVRAEDLTLGQRH